MAKDDESKEHLLRDCEEAKHNENNIAVSTSSGHSLKSWQRTWWLCQVLVFGANLVVLIGLTSQTNQVSGLRRKFELIEAPIRATTVTWDASLGQNVSFTAMDSKVADAAWAEIAVTPTQGYVHLTKDQLKQIGKYHPSSVMAADGSGYLGLVGVFHQLHCLDYLRKTNILYTHMYPNTVESPTVPIEYHIPHCINLLRMALQCYGELTTSTMDWVDGWLEPWEDWQTQHQCRNFDVIREWARKNNANTTGAFVHPELGPVIHSKLNASALPVGRKVRYVDAHNEDMT